MTSKDDRISSLPDEILCLIISRLTLGDAARTHVLSHRWSHLRPSHSNLNFDWPNMFLTGENLPFSDSSQQPCTCAEYKEKFVKGVSETLESYEEGKQAIQSFSLSFCVKSFAGDVDGWVRSAIKMGAQTFSLAVYCRHTLSKVTRSGFFLEPHRGRYYFRRKLLEGAQANVRHLRLYACNLGPNFTSQFSSLESLYLKYAALSKYDLQSLFCSLVKLKALTFFCCSLPMRLCLGPLLCLESFKLKVCRGLARLELSNENLFEFKHLGPEGVTLIFKGVPNLWKFTYFLKDDDQFRCVFTLLPQQLPKLRELYIKTEEDWVNKIPQSIVTFTTVTRLRLTFFQQTKFDLLKMVSILKAFPLLRQLHLMMCCQEDGEQGQLDSSGFALEHLEEVEFCGFCTSSQIEFVIFLLKHAPVLGQVVIREHEWYNSLCSERCKVKHQWKEGERQKVIEQLKKFSENTNVCCLF